MHDIDRIDDRELEDGVDIDAYTEGEFDGLDPDEAPAESESDDEPGFEFDDQGDSPGTSEWESLGDMAPRYDGGTVEELAAELMQVSDDQELQLFLGKLVKRASKGVTKFARSPAGKALGQGLKRVAKVALPIAARAAGAYFGGPQGAQIGGALGDAVAGSIDGTGGGGGFNLPGGLGGFGSMQVPGLGGMQIPGLGGLQQQGGGGFQIPGLGGLQFPGLQLPSSIRIPGLPFPINPQAFLPQGFAEQSELRRSGSLEFEAGKRFVKFAAEAVRNAARTSPSLPPKVALKNAIVSAAKKHAPGLLKPGRALAAAGGALIAPASTPRSGRWVRHGNKIVLLLR